MNLYKKTATGKQLISGGGATNHNALSGRDAEDAHPMSAITGLEDALSGKVDSDTLGVKNGVAALDENGKLPSTQLPSHNQPSSTINTMTGYTKPDTTSGIETTDTLNQAIGKLEKAIDDTNDKVADIELFKFPNATIIGAPTINNGQVSNFSNVNYMRFPFIVNMQGKPFEINMAFTTSTNVTTQQNILDGLDHGIAFAVRNGKFVLVLSSKTGEWDISAGEKISSVTVATNTSYIVRFSWDGSVYKVEYSVNGESYTEDTSLRVTSSLSLYPTQVFIGIASVLSSAFTGIINMNYSSLKIAGKTVWTGMDDVGLATRMAVDMSNIDSAGESVVKSLSEYTNGNGISIDNTTRTVTNTGVRGFVESDEEDANGTFRSNVNGKETTVSIKGLGNAAYKGVQSEMTSTSTDLPTSQAVAGYVSTEINKLPTPMTYEGSVGTGGDYATLASIESPTNGMTLKVISAMTVESESAKAGDTVIYNDKKRKWDLIPSADEPNTLETVKINGDALTPDSDKAVNITITTDTTNKNGTITVNGVDKEVYVHPSGTNPHGTTKEDVGLGNVGNFKAVSTVGSQGLSETEQANARNNIGAGTSSFSGSYDDLTNKLPIVFQEIGTQTLDIDDIKLNESADPLVVYSRSTSDAGALNISNIPLKKSFLLRTESVCRASASNYTTKQTFISSTGPTSALYDKHHTREWTRYCTNGTWTQWSLNMKECIDDNTRIVGTTGTGGDLWVKVGTFPALGTYDGGHYVFEITTPNSGNYPHYDVELWEVTISEKTASNDGHEPKFYIKRMNLDCNDNIEYRLSNNFYLEYDTTTSATPVVMWFNKTANYRYATIRMLRAMPRGQSRGYFTFEENTHSSSVCISSTDGSFITEGTTHVIKSFKELQTLSKISQFQNDAGYLTNDDVDTTPTKDSTKLITSGAVESSISEIKNYINNDGFDIEDNTDDIITVSENVRDFASISMIGGKTIKASNLFDMKSIKGNTSSVSITVDDDDIATINVTGWTANAYISNSQYIPVTYGKTYVAILEHISGRMYKTNDTTTNKDVGMQSTEYSDETTSISSTTSYTKFTFDDNEGTRNYIEFTPSSTDAKFLRLAVWSNGTTGAGSNFDNYKFRIRIYEKTDNATTDYVTFGNYLWNAPVEKIMSKGNNLFDGKWVDMYVNVDTLQFKDDYTISYSAIVKCEPNTTYTISKKDTSNRLRIATSSEIPTVSTYANRIVNKSHSLTEFTFTTQDDDNYIFVYAGADERPSGLKIEIGETKTPYMDYLETEISLADITKNLPDYGCSAGEKFNYIDFERGVYVHQVKTLKLSELSWIYRSGDDKLIYTNVEYGIRKISEKSILVNAITPLYETTTRTDQDNNKTDKTIAGSANGSLVTNGVICILDSDYTLDKYATTNELIAAFKENLGDTVINIEMATPEDIPLSDTFYPIEVESGGTISFINEHNLDVPSKVIFKKEV